MSNYMYKTTAPSVVAAVIAWDTKRADWNMQRDKLGQVFGGETSPMRSGSRSYVGGVKLSASRDLDVHWCRPDQYGYRALRSRAKPAKGAPKEARDAQVAEHDRLSALWKEHCPASIDMDEAWEAIGLNPGALWMCGGVFFELDGVVYLNLGLRLEDGHENIEGAAEILGSEFEAARQLVLDQRKAA
ncbi:hypothetical protein [Pseudomonas poae]|uniref:hypothetical protein n=1 Tax=Pseudomonas poae TaxID=200451 RepID=UPI001646EE23|nr:hypothetical protein [Pseudomonas poae]MBC3196980.1 hypothetical protein [Pseudomonas poae]